MKIFVFRRSQSELRAADRKSDSIERRTDMLLVWGFVVKINIQKQSVFITLE